MARRRTEAGKGTAPDPSLRRARSRPSGHEPTERPRARFPWRSHAFVSRCLLLRRGKVPARERPNVRELLSLHGVPPPDRQRFRDQCGDRGRSHQAARGRAGRGGPAGRKRPPSRHLSLPDLPVSAMERLWAPPRHPLRARGRARRPLGLPAGRAHLHALEAPFRTEGGTEPARGYLRSLEKGDRQVCGAHAASGAGLRTRRSWSGEEAAGREALRAQARPEQQRKQEKKK